MRVMGNPPARPGRGGPWIGDPAHPAAFDFCCGALLRNARPAADGDSLGYHVQGGTVSDPHARVYCGLRGRFSIGHPVFSGNPSVLSLSLYRKSDILPKRKSDTLIISVQH